MRSTIKAGAAVALAMAGWAAGARAHEEKIALDKVPAAVMKAAKARFPGAEIKGAEKEVEDGKTTYEIGLVHEGHKIDVVITPEGTVKAVETTIEATDLPAAVTAAITAKYPQAAVKKAERIEEDGKTTYEVKLMPAKGKAVEVLMDSKGKVLKTEDEDDDDDKNEDKDKEKKEKKDKDN